MLGFGYWNCGWWVLDVGLREIDCEGASPLATPARALAFPGFSCEIGRIFGCLIRGFKGVGGGMDFEHFGEGGVEFGVEGGGVNRGGGIGAGALEVDLHGVERLAD